jgi:hypothetical protein
MNADLIMFFTLYLCITIVSCFFVLYVEPKFKSKLPDQVRSNLESYSNEINKLFGYKGQIGATHSICALLQIIFYLRFPNSKGDLFAMIFEIITYCLSFIVAIINSYSWIYQTFKLSEIDLHNSEEKSPLFYFKMWIERIHQWGSFRIYTVALITLVLHGVDLVLSLLG